MTAVSSHGLSAANTVLPQLTVTTPLTSLTITAEPDTDLWRTPSRDVSSAPIIYKAIRLAAFTRLRATVHVPFGGDRRLYDQGGVVFLFPDAHPQKWIKSGIELVNSGPGPGGQLEAKMSTVVADRYADWSLGDLPVQTSGSPEAVVTIEMEKQGESLWVFVVDEKNERKPVREVTWVFGGLKENEAKDVWIGAYAARPTKLESEKSTEGESLVVTFRNLDL